ncbi:PH domain-containing protein [Exiguobacterium acetylicum]|uniref:PH domain-containing protein n=1 Tax=Exiguobacterium acetylicum TaxID=41170 RepID=UPI0039778F38
MRQEPPMTSVKLHPAWIPYRFGIATKEVVFVALIISFLFRRLSLPLFSWYGYTLLGSFILVRLIGLVLQWKHFTYQLKKQELLIEKGAFVTEKKQIPYERIQGITEYESLFHRVTGLTSLVIETGSTDSDADVRLEMLSKQEATQIKEQIESIVTRQHDAEALPEVATTMLAPNQEQYAIQFKEIALASLTSLSPLFFFFLLYSVYQELSRFLELDNIVNSIVTFSTQSNVMSIAMIGLLIMLALGYGVFRNYRLYAGFRIDADQRSIQIEKGWESVTRFSISKDRIQALTMRSRFIHQLLGISQVKMISSIDPEQQDKNTSAVLFPFVHRSKALDLIPKMLPDFKMATRTLTIPRQAIVVKLCRTGLLWGVIPICLWIMFPNLRLLAVLICFAVITSQFLSRHLSTYTTSATLLHFHQGGLAPLTYWMRRDGIERLELSESYMQQRLGLATVTVTLHATPAKEVRITDVPIDWAKQCQRWYIERS